MLVVVRVMGDCSPFCSTRGRAFAAQLGRINMKSVFRAGLFCALGLAASCSDSGSSGSKPTTDSSQIGKSGGVVSAADESVAASVDVPQGALPSAVKIGVAVSEVDVAPPDGYVLAGPPIAFTPHGLTFDVPVTLT